MSDLCPRAIEDGYTAESVFRFENKPEDNTCEYCGSMFGDEFMRRLEAGDISLSPTDKSYKVYVHNDSGAPFLQSHRTDEPSKPGEVMKDPMDQSHWTWKTEERQQCKFYFQHLSEKQQRRCRRIVMRKPPLKRQNELMAEAIDRYLELCREGADQGVCEIGDHEDDCPFEERPCLAETGGLCHWCQLDAARAGKDYRVIEAKRT